MEENAGEYFCDLETRRVFLNKTFNLESIRVKFFYHILIRIKDLFNEGHHKDNVQVMHRIAEGVKCL